MKYPQKLLIPVIDKKKTGIHLRRLMDERGLSVKDVQQYPAYQQINDLIERFQKIDAAIVDSNTKTEVKTSYGTFTVAGAISLRSRLRGMDSYDGDADFEGKLQEKLNNEYNERVRFCDMKNSQLQNTAESMRLSILGRDTKAKDDKPLGVVDAYVRENTTEPVDPLDVKKKLELHTERIVNILMYPPMYVDIHQLIWEN